MSGHDDSLKHPDAGKRPHEEVLEGGQKKFNLKAKVKMDVSSRTGKRPQAPSPTPPPRTKLQG